MNPSEILIGHNACVHNMHVGGWCDSCAAKINSRLEGRCVNCLIRKSDGDWVGDGGVMGWVHGMHEPWCNLCMRRAQLQHAEEAAARVEQLRREVAELEEVGRVPPRERSSRPVRSEP